MTRTILDPGTRDSDGRGREIQSDVEREFERAEDALFAHLMRCDDCMGLYCEEATRLTKIRDDLERELDGVPER